MEQESELRGINSQQSFEALSLKLNGQIKTWMRMTEYHPIHQSPGIGRPVKFIGGAFENTTVQPDRWRQASGRSSS
jgi:hypothetical protein